jgi:hypothetical protein
MDVYSAYNDYSDIYSGHVHILRNWHRHSRWYNNIVDMPNMSEPLHLLLVLNMWNRDLDELEKDDDQYKYMYRRESNPLIVTLIIIVSGVNQGWKRCIGTHPFMLNHVDFTIAPSNIPDGVMIQLINKAGSRIRSIIISSYRVFQLASTFQQLSLPLLSSITIIGHIYYSRNESRYISQFSQLLPFSSIKLTTTCSCIWMHPTRWVSDDLKQRFQCQGISIDGNCDSCHSRHVTMKTCSKCQQSYCIKCVVDKFQHCPSCTFTGCHVC